MDPYSQSQTKKWNKKQSETNREVKEEAKPEGIEDNKPNGTPVSSSGSSPSPTLLRLSIEMKNFTQKESNLNTK